jgi:hypothetical protein
LTTPHYFPTVSGDSARQDVKEGTFAAPGRTDQNGKSILGKRQIEIFEDCKVAEAFIQTRNIQHEADPPMRAAAGGKGEIRM